MATPSPLERIHRLVIVRRDAIHLYDELSRLWKFDPRTRVIFDRRHGHGPATATRDRRRRDNADIIQARGFYVQRLSRAF